MVNGWSGDWSESLPLAGAARGGFAECCELLLAYHGDVNAPTVCPTLELERVPSESSALIIIPCMVKFGGVVVEREWEQPRAAGKA